MTCAHFSRVVWHRTGVEADHAKCVFVPWESVGSRLLTSVSYRTNVNMKSCNYCDGNCHMFMIHSFNTVKHNYLIKILVTGSPILHSFRQHVSVFKRPSSGLQRAENVTCKGFLWYAMGSHCVPKKSFARHIFSSL